MFATEPIRRHSTLLPPRCRSSVFLGRHEVSLTAILSDIPNEGALLEFGVWKGASITHIAGICASRRIHGFDSFQGLPEPWRGTRHERGAYSASGKLPRVPSNVQLYPGLFTETIPQWLNAHPESIAFVHIDCDIYASTRTILQLIRSRLREGLVIVFDEYFKYPCWQQHQHRAFREFVAETGLTTTSRVRTGQLQSGSPVRPLPRSTTRRTSVAVCDVCAKSCQQGHQDAVTTHSTSSTHGAAANRPRSP